jgi:hypothetical protein
MRRGGGSRRPERLDADAIRRAAAALVGSAERQKCHVSALKWTINFSAYLSDLFSHFVTRIGALGLKPTYSRTTRGRQLGFAGGRGLRV